ncbi:protein CHROMATIN REMODELING 25 [Rutidosis leptorrhynchoides]|uniref:protein CHROMATIN REMODELING 25 n=1 Tax=Rutidosis leptorrhynchoides TaxID=125765 RepID=UPI003A98E890
MEDDEPFISISDSTDSSDDFTCEESESEDESLSTSDIDANCKPNDVVPPPPEPNLKSQNVNALLRGNLVVRRQSLLPRVLSVTEREAVLRKPFKPPCADGYSNQNDQLARRLCARKRFVPWGSNRPVLVPITNRLNIPVSVEEEVPEESTKLPPDIEPLILWQSEKCEDGDGRLIRIEVDHILVKFLRPHQREGVQFMFECVSGVCSPDINGCILADDMGLGKTLQSITLLYTLLRQGFDGQAIVKKAIIVTPTSLVSNWEAEIQKWVGERVKLVALCESSRDDVISSIDNFRSTHSRLQVLIVSYETFRMHASKFKDSGSCDLLICDEAHRLKNDQTLTNKALAAVSCKRRILLSGTPMQNHLEEFYAMVNFTNPGILGDAARFRRYYETPIICGREPTASEEEKNLANERSAELSAKVNQFILRRTNALLSNHLPPKIVGVVCCKLTPLQKELYNHFIHSKNVKQAISEDVKQTKILAYITALKKLCNHPKLIYDTMKSGNPGTAGFEGCMRFFPPEMFSGRSGSWTGGDGAWVELSGKMHVLARLLAHLRKKTDDRIVLVSNYTQTLDLIVQLCRERRYPFLRLDGATSISKRQKLVNCFNDQSKDEFAFLLSSKAGGCGLNLIGGNRLVLFDPDWNPANDKQAAARVWRDGQKKRVYIYRFLSTGTIEEKVYQRQMSKEGLQKVIQQEQSDSKIQGNNLSTEDLRDLFTFHEDAKSEIHEKMNCTRCQNSGGRAAEEIADASIDEFLDEGSHSDEEDIGGFAGISGCLHNLKSSEKQVGSPLEEDLASWGHHFSPNTVPDTILQASAGDEVTFVFTNQISGKLVPVESAVRSKTENLNEEIHTSKGNGFKNQCVSLKRQQTIPFSWSKGRPIRSKLPTAIRKSTGKPIEGKSCVALKPKSFFENLLPQKRLYTCPVDDDDDFA